MTQNKTKMKNSKIASKALSWRLSWLQVCQLHAYLTIPDYILCSIISNSQLDRSAQLEEGCFVRENKSKKRDKICSLEVSSRKIKSENLWSTLRQVDS